MQEFVFQDTSIENLKLITPFYAPDSRGYLTKAFEKSIFSAHGIDIQPWEELRSFSKKGILRGLHFQRRNSQDKLVQVLHGAVYDVAVDLRKDSPTFGKWEGFYLTAENRQTLYIPKNFAHGFLALEDGTLLNYLCGDRCDPGSEDGIIWNDPELKIQWPLRPEQPPVLSQRDQGFQTFAQFINSGGY